MLLYIASFIIFLFVSFNLFFRTDLGAAARVAGCCLVLFASLKYEIYQFVGGAFFAPQLPRAALIFFEALYGALIILFFLLLLWDIYLLGNWLLARAGVPVPRNLPTGAIRAGLAVLALALGAWGTWQAIKVPEPRTIEIRLANLPPALDGLALVQLTDLHIGPILGRDWLAQVVSRVNALEPDLVLLTGDYIDGYASELASELQPLADLKARYGVLGSTGNHEYYWNMPEWRKELEDLNIRILDNSHRSFKINGETIVVAGIPDLNAARFGFDGPDLDAALRDAPEAVRILLTHQPKMAREYSAQADVMLSGHTHGGLMFFLQPLIARFNAGFVSGLYPVNGKNLYVSPGTGLWNGFSCRIGVPAEITRIILRSSQNPQQAAS
ncbi:MAG: metallophosphoesterase [Desulfovibrio sp.]|nr:metallophosphoesterase [Desulfovibrio sp.]